MARNELGSGSARLGRIALICAAVLAGTPTMASAAPLHDPGVAMRSAAGPGVVYGGMMPSGFGVMVEVSKSRTQVVRMAAGMRLECTSGGLMGVPDGWSRLRISKGKFSAQFGPETERNADGSTTDAEGSVTGRFNSGFTSVSGTWTLKLTHRDAAGVVVDTCDSGDVRWKGKQ